MKQHLRNTHFFKQWHVHVTVTNILNRINLLLILVACSLLALSMLHLYDSIILFFLSMLDYISTMSTVAVSLCVLFCAGL